MIRPVYLDNAATTAVDPRVVARMVPCLYERFGNASANHVFGWRAEEAIEIAREEVAATIGCAPSEIVWTSGASEANTLALMGVIDALPRDCRHVVSVATEHASVLATLRAAEAAGAIRLTLVGVDGAGRVDRRAFAAALTPDTALASVMWVNNETGTVQDIVALGRLCHERSVLLHVDAAQAVGKVDIDLGRLPVDLMSMSAHKIHGPQGVGALFVRDTLRGQLLPRQRGGGQEGGLRAGTLPLHQIVGLGEAYRLVRENAGQDRDRLLWLRQRLLEPLLALGGVQVHGDAEHGVPHILNLGFDGLVATTLIGELQAQVAVSAGSACASTHVAPSHVLSAMGIEPQQALSALRLSLGRFTRASDIDTAVEAISAAVLRLRAAKPADASDDDGEDCPMKRLRRRAAQRISRSGPPARSVPVQPGA